MNSLEKILMSKKYAYMSQLFTLVLNTNGDGWQLSKQAYKKIKADGETGRGVILVNLDGNIMWVSDEEAKQHGVKELDENFFELNPDLLPAIHNKEILV